MGPGNTSDETTSGDANDDRVSSFERILDLTGAIIVELDRDGRVAMINRAGARLLGRPKSEILGRDWFDEFIPESFRSEVTGTFASLMAGTLAPVEYFQNLVLTASGERLIGWHNAIRHDDHGAIVGTLSSGLDITERVEIESLRRAREILDNLFTFVALLTPDGTVVDVNRAPLDVGGLSREEVLGRPYWECAWWRHDPATVERIRVACARAAVGEVLRFDVMIADRQGCLMPIDFMIAPQRDAAGRITFLIPSAVDITARAAGEERLRRSERKYRETVERLMEGIYSTHHGVFTSVNRAMCEIFGFAESELVGRPAWELAEPGRREEIRNAFFHLATLSEPPPLEVPCCRKDGTPIVAEVRISGRTEDGEFFGLVIDITERKAAEAALVESERRFRQLFEENADALFWADAESGFLIDCNAAAERLLGKPRARIIGTHQSSFHPPEDLERVREVFRQHAEQGKGFAADMRVRRANGGLIWVSITATQVQVDGRRVIQGCFRDLTDRLRVEEERLRTLVQHSFDMILVIDGLGLITYQSPAVERVLGYAAETARGTALLDYVHDDDRGRAAEALRLIAAEPGRIERIEVRGRRRDGSWRELEASGICITEADGLPRIVINGRDITVRKRAEAALKESYDQLKTVEGQRRDFLASVAHELRTPLAVTLGAVESLLGAKAGPLSEDQARMLEIVRRHAERLNRLFDNLLDLARGEAGRLRVEPVPLDLRRPVEEAVQGFQPLLGRKELGLRLVLPDAAVPVAADADKIIQITCNLLENAMRYAVREITVHLEHRGDRVVLSVHNDGPCIPDDHLPHLFELYYRVEGAPRKGHTGLGLSIVRLIAEAHGGSAWAENNADRTHFIVSLPSASG